MGPTLREAWRALWPTLALLALALGLLATAGFGALPFHTVPGVLPLMIAVGAGLHALWLGRFNLLLIVLALVLGHLAIDTLIPGAPGRDGFGRVLYPAVAVLLPLDLALFALARERGVLTPSGMAKAGLLALQAVLVWLLVWHGTADVTATADAWLHARPLPREVDLWTHLPQPALIVAPLALIALAARFSLTASTLDAGLIGALLASMASLHQVADPLARDLWATAAFACLALALVRESHRLAFVDELTSLPGRRALDAALARAGRRYAVAMVDIDHFKAFNDTHGHDVGDQVLRLVASRLATVGGGGRAYRYGGEEFTILFPGRDGDHAVPHLEAVREAVAEAGFVKRDADRPAKAPKAKGKAKKAGRLSVTVSIGLAEHEPDDGPAEAVLKAADAALCKAKGAGRNRLARAG